MRAKHWGASLRLGTLVVAVLAGTVCWTLSERSEDNSSIVATATQPAVVTAQANYFFLSKEKEAQLGKDEFKKMKKSKKMVRGSSQDQMIQRVASRLVPLTNVPDAEWEFVLFDDSTPNAFALPGGKVGVHTGLFKVVDNEAQLAAVLGHELAHVFNGDAGRRIRTAGVAMGAATIGGLILKKKTGSDAPGAIAQGAATLGVLQFSRSQELAADRDGTLLMAQAGYDPEESVTLWQQFSRYKAESGGNKVPGFLSTHPVDSRRIQELQALMPEAKKLYRPVRSAKPADEEPQKAAPASDLSPVNEEEKKQEKEIPKAQRFWKIFRAQRPE